MDKDGDVNMGEAEPMKEKVNTAPGKSAGEFFPLFILH